jgi:type II secretory pathway component GspD/PulD (secretin)
VGGTTNAVTTTSQYIDTGVLLQVTPHINAGGLVSLDVQAEVSNPGVATACPADQQCAPPINTRSVQTYVSVQSGQTMIMGGLIQDTRQNSSTGIPWLSRIPILGGLFGNQSLQNDRTELVLFITPRVVESEVDLRVAIDDLRRKMDNLDAVIPLMKPILGPVFPYTPANPNVPPILMTPPYTNPPPTPTTTIPTPPATPPTPGSPTPAAPTPPAPKP